MTLPRRTFGDYWSPRFLFVDTHEAAEPLWWVVGSQRSGTTWIAALIDPDRRARLIFEPFHGILSRFAHAIPFSWGRYVAPDATDPALEAAVGRIATGRMRDPWTDRHNHRRLYRTRMVKDVSTTNLLPWLTVQRPDDRFVHVLRHPFAVAWSLESLGWGEEAATDALFAQPELLDGPLADVPGLADLIARAASDNFVRLVLKWCFENAVPLRANGDVRFDTICYEDAVRDPVRALAEVGVGLRIGDPARPSTSDFRGRSGTLRDRRDQLVTGWLGHVGPEQVRAGLEVLAAFGLDHLYGEDPWPRARR